MAARAAAVRVYAERLLDGVKAERLRIAAAAAAAPTPAASASDDGMGAALVVCAWRGEMAQMCLRWLGV
jgi:hypothetical protein